MIYLAQAIDTAIIGKGLMIGGGFIGPGIGIGIIGGNYMQQSVATRKLLSFLAKHWYLLPSLSCLLYLPSLQYSSLSKGYVNNKRHVFTTSPVFW